MRQTPTSIRDNGEMRAHMISTLDAEVYSGHGGLFRLHEADDDRLLREWARLPDRAPSSDPRDVLRSCGVPIRESHVDLVKQLDAKLSAGHPDRDQLRPILRHGAALTQTDRDQVEVLAAKHGLLHGAQEVDDEDETSQPWLLDDTGSQEHEDKLTESESLQILREAGVPLTAWASRRLPQVKPSSISVVDIHTALQESGLLVEDTGDRLDILRECGVPTRG